MALSQRHLSWILSPRGRLCTIRACRRPTTWRVSLCYEHCIDELTRLHRQLEVFKRGVADYTRAIELVEESIGPAPAPAVVRGRSFPRTESGLAELIEWVLTDESFTG